MLAYALGMLPFKDSFFSSDKIPGSSNCMTCLYSNWTEPYPWVHALVAALSAGPVSPGDGVGGIDKDLVMSTCRADGLLLKPDRPATPLDSYWLARAFGGAVGPTGEVWSTESLLCDASTCFRWYFVVGMDLRMAYNVTPSQVIQAAHAWSDSTAVSSDYVAYDFRVSPRVVQDFSQSKPLYFAPGQDYGACTYYIACPALGNGWTFLGEQDKFIAISNQRFSDLRIGENSFELSVHGKPSENVTVAASRGGKTMKKTLTIPHSSVVVLTFP